MKGGTDPNETTPLSPSASPKDAISMDGKGDEILEAPPRKKLGFFAPRCCTPSKNKTERLLAVIEGCRTTVNVGALGYGAVDATNKTTAIIPAAITELVVSSLILLLTFKSCATGEDRVDKNLLRFFLCLISITGASLLLADLDCKMTSDLDKKTCLKTILGISFIAASAGISRALSAYNTRRDPLPQDARPLPDDIKGMYPSTLQL